VRKQGVPHVGRKPDPLDSGGAVDFESAEELLFAP
jgi:hypothetical protein